MLSITRDTVERNRARVPYTFASKSNATRHLNGMLARLSEVRSARVVRIMPTTYLREAFAVIVRHHPTTEES